MFFQSPEEQEQLDFLAKLQSQREIARTLYKKQQAIYANACGTPLGSSNTVALNQGNNGLMSNTNLQQNRYYLASQLRDDSALTPLVMQKNAINSPILAPASNNNNMGGLGANNGNMLQQQQ